MKQSIKSALAISAGMVAVVGAVLTPVGVGAVSSTSNTTVTAQIQPVITIIGPNGQYLDYAKRYGSGIEQQRHGAREHQP